MHYPQLCSTLDEEILRLYDPMIIIHAYIHMRIILERRTINYIKAFTSDKLLCSYEAYSDDYRYGAA